MSVRFTVQLYYFQVEILIIYNYNKCKPTDERKFVEHCGIFNFFISANFTLIKQAPKARAKKNGKIKLILSNFFFVVLLYVNLIFSLGLRIMTKKI